MTRRTGCLNRARPDLWEAAEATPPPTRPDVFPFWMPILGGGVGPFWMPITTRALVGKGMPAATIRRKIPARWFVVHRADKSRGYDAQD
jgi:hypothetical protein